MVIGDLKVSHPFDILKLPNGASFIFTPCPGTKGTPLHDTMTQLKTAGASSVISMLSNQELEFLNVPDLGETCERIGLSWYQLPIEDDEGPEQPFERSYAKHKTALLAAIENKETVVIHCRGGTGRTGLMAAILLLDFGLNWSETKTLVQSIRPKALTIESQVDYLVKAYSL
jgi:protein-tyrosine phosphatase